MNRNDEERRRIGQDIASLRKELKMTQEQLSQQTGILRNHLSRIEKGHYSVGFDTLSAIAVGPCPANTITWSLVAALSESCCAW